ncbi:MAG: MmcQ/YjbR family DNA-binding protein [Firmicutes bacterium]|nr:MmcQ/YjbR family DNA-binding protein [Bacillota bacterium]
MLELINLCLKLENTCEEYPFYPDSPVIRHSVGTRKIFAVVFERDGLCVNLKIKPGDGDALRRSFENILPAYHMNKDHWVMVKLGGDVDDELLQGLIKNSYEITRPKHTPKKKMKEV